MPHIQHSHPEESAMVDHHYKCTRCGQDRIIRMEQNGLEVWQTKGQQLNIVCPKCEGQLGPSTTEYFRDKASPGPKREDPVSKMIKTWVPPIYQDSDVERFPSGIWETKRYWIPGAKGMLLYGPPRTYKSRMAYQLAIQHAKLQKPIRCYDPRSFRAMIERNIERRTLWDWFEKDALVPFFLLDDLGKFRGEGRRIEEEVFNLVKIRQENKLGMIITSNCDGNELAATFTPSIGIPIIERLREMCEDVWVKQPLTQETEVPHVDPRTADL